jgi:hypothetical protein
MAARLHCIDDPTMSNAPRYEPRIRNASAASSGPRKNGIAEVTLVDPGAARQPTLVGIPAPARRAAEVGPEARPSLLNDKTLVDPPRALPPNAPAPNAVPPRAVETMERSIPLPLVTKKRSDANALPLREEEHEERDAQFEVRNGLVVEARKPRGRGVLWMLLVITMAGAAGYHFRDRLKERVAPSLTSAWRAIAAAANPPRIAPDTPPVATTPAAPPVTSPPHISASPATASAPLLAPPEPVAPSAPKSAPRAPVATTTHAPLTAKPAPSHKGTSTARAKPAPQAQNDNPY